MAIEPNATARSSKIAAGAVTRIPVTVEYGTATGRRKRVSYRDTDVDEESGPSRLASTSAMPAAS